LGWRLDVEVDLLNISLALSHGEGLLGWLGVSLEQGSGEKLLGLL
jgi:hypothetical protein